MARDSPRQRIRCRSPASKKRLDKLKNIQSLPSALRGSGTQLHLEIALLNLFDSATKLNKLKTLNEKAKFVIKVLMSILLTILIYQLIQNPQLAEELLKEIITNFIIN